MKSLAFVIPTYRALYLKDTLNSLVNQTCQDFSVYVGDDASPDDIESIINEFWDRLDIIYRRFEENLGGKDLVGHWERCVKLCQDEEWVCLFSDDDILEPRCVESFLAYDKKGQVDVMHFNLSIINKEGQLLRECSDYPDIISPTDFFHKLATFTIDARMPEFIFRRRTLLEKGFVNFDLAWRSDNATVMSIAGKKGIATINGLDARVRWRSSDINLSSYNTHAERKTQATICFFNWYDNYLIETGQENPFSFVMYLKKIVFWLEYRNVGQFMSSALCAGRKLHSAKGWRKPLYYILIFYRIIYQNK